MRTGRPNKGIEHVKSTDAAADTQRRLELILETISGNISVKDASAELGITCKRFQQLRAAALQGAAHALEPGQPGRPRKVDAEDRAELDSLRSKVKRLETDLVGERVARDLLRNMSAIEDASKKNKRDRKRGRT